jgi:bifunctional non-homologous end joining protein LigD
MPPPKLQAKFVDPMLLLRTDKLPDRDGWLNELKLDGFRAVAFKTGGKVHLRSRNDKDFSANYPAIVKALARLPDETVIDGEIVALEGGRPSFSALQNHDSSALFYYAFDVMIAAGKDVMAQAAHRAGHFPRRRE